MIQLNNILASLTKLLSIAVLVAFTGIIFNSCSDKAINISSPSYLRNDTSYKTDSLEGFIILPDSKAMLRSMHDEDSIYLEVKAEDRLTLQSILINGLTVWIDPKAKRNEDYGVIFIAARSEMFRRREELVKQLEKSQDDIASDNLYTTQTWVDAVNQRDVVIKDVNGTRFAEKYVAHIFLDRDGSLNYVIQFGYDQLGIEYSTTNKISVGVISEVHQAQLQGASQSSMGGPPGTGMRTPQQSRQRPQQQVRMPQVPLEAWVILLLGEDEADTENKEE